MSMHPTPIPVDPIGHDVRRRIPLMRPELCADGWEIVRPGFFETHTAQRLLGRKSDHTWEWCETAIRDLRALAGLRPKEFKPPPERSKEGFLAKSPRTLLHGTSLASVPSIQAEGLIPQVGRFAGSAHGAAEKLVYAGAISDFHRVVAAMYYQGGDIETDSDFFERTALITLPNDGKWYRTKAGYHSPVGTEGGDFYRSEPIMPGKVIAGDDLREFFDARIGRLPSDFVDFIEKDRPVGCRP